MKHYDCIIIGGGHNGLVTAAYLARAGRKTLVLERRPLVGGAAVTEEIFPGFKFSVFSYVVSLLRPEIIRDLELPRHGLQILPLESTVVPLDNGDYLGSWADPDQSRRELARHSARDAEAAVLFGRLMHHMAMAVRPILSMVPPDPTSMSPGDLRGMLKFGGHFRSLGGERFHALYKLMTMSSADYLDEWFEFDPLKATKSASGIIGTFLGPRSPGTAYVLLHHYMGEIDGAFRAWGFQKGGTGAISETISRAAQALGAEVRTNAAVDRVIVKHGRATGVALASGEEISAPVIVSGLDPRRTFLELVDAREMPTEVVDAIGRFKFRGSSGKVNLALSELPDLTCLPGYGPHLRGAISISPSLDYLERAYDDAKYGEFSTHPYMDIVIPSMIDPGMAPPGRHVMSCFVQYAPYNQQGGWTDAKREAFGDAVVDTLARYAPNIKSAIIGRQVLTPDDIERTTGLTEGNIFAGELALHQLFFFRPIQGWADYRTPIKGYWQCGAGTHPGGGIMGASGRLAALEILKGRRVVSAAFDVVVIGGGVNAMVMAAILGKAGRRVLLLERSDQTGGQCGSAEFAPGGFRAAPLAVDAGWVPPQVVRELGLTGIDKAVPAVTVAAPAGSGAWLPLATDITRAADAIRRFSPGDADRWAAFCTRLGKLADFLQALYVLPAPDVDTSSLSEILPLLGVARKLRGLGKADMVEFLRTVPMSVQEFLDDWFACDPLKAAIGAGGVTDIRQGPRSGGTAFVLLHHQVGAAAGAIRGRGYWNAGPEALARSVADAAARFGVSVRTGAAVVRVLVKDDRATGVVLASGEEIAAPVVVSGSDPAHTLLELVDPVWFDPEFLLAVRNIKFRGNSARVLYALDDLPTFPGLPDSAQPLTGSLSLASSLDQLERAYDDSKYGRMSRSPAVEIQVPSVRWPATAPPGKHVVVARAESAPYRLRDGEWDDAKRAALGDAVTARIAEVSPGFPGLIRHRVVITPVELEATFGLTEGAVTHGEMTLDQILFMRPVPGASRYATPLAGLYLCGAGTHPGSGIPGGPGWLAARRVMADQK